MNSQNDIELQKLNLRLSEEKRTTGELGCRKDSEN